MTDAIESAHRERHAQRALVDDVQLERAMRRAFELARRGPVQGGNPQVGCVLLDADGAVVAEGFHRGAGTPHAEADALAALAQLGRDGTGLTAVVSLEPCAHHGRTPPCADALVAAGVARVVYAIADPTPRAAGGAETLRAAGVDVREGLLADEGEALLDEWLTAERLGRPHVTVKWASTLDGRVAAADGSSRWITGAPARRLVHEQRARADAILVGTGTVLADDPALTARGDGDELLPHQPLPVVVGERAVPAAARIRNHPAGLVETGTRDLDAVLRDLFARGVRRVFVEGGPSVTSALVAAGLVDRFLVYLAPALLGGDRLAIGDLGVTSMAGIRRLEIERVELVGGDVLVTARPARPARAADTAAAAPTHSPVPDGGPTDQEVD